MKQAKIEEEKLNNIHRTKKMKEPIPNPTSLPFLLDPFQSSLNLNFIQILQTARSLWSLEFFVILSWKSYFIPFRTTSHQFLVLVLILMNLPSPLVTSVLLRDGATISQIQDVIHVYLGEEPPPSNDSKIEVTIQFAEDGSIQNLNTQIPSESTDIDFESSFVKDSNGGQALILDVVGWVHLTIGIFWTTSLTLLGTK